ncbi:hypothetical protein FXO37_34077 [Capsicum annuum]|nr:hypothetical protein FXO37_34077 [Capsicum annuum]
MDSCPNFSLGLSQLDIPVGFVPGTFHFEESDFAENRSKHRNDPTTMKKLKEATTSKSEKSTSKTANKKTALQHGNIIPRILNWSVECTRPKYESFMSGMFSKCSFKNLQPTNKEVRTLDLFFFENFVVFDPISAASTSVAAKIQTAGDEDQSRVVTRDDDYDDFTTGPTQKFLRNAHLAKPVSTEQPFKRRKTVILQKVSPVATDGQKSTSSHSVCRVSEIGVSPEREQLKSVPSSSSMPEGTSKSNLNVEQIKSYIKTYIAELKTLISNIPTEVVKALKKEENKESLV